MLAAGKGTRFQTEGESTPKVLRMALGKPLLDYVLSSIDFIPEKDIYVVVGFSRELVYDFLRFRGQYRTALQSSQRGTGDAVRAAAPKFSSFEGDVLVTAGDMPLVREETYRALLRRHKEEQNACTILSARVDDPAGYGRILRDASSAFSDIREHADCSEDERRIAEVNTSIYAFDAKALFAALDRLTPTNAQGEFYLTDVPRLLREDGKPVGVYLSEDGGEMMGVNTPEQLGEVERALRRRTAK